MIASEAAACHDPRSPLTPTPTQFTVHCPLSLNDTPYRASTVEPSRRANLAAALAAAFAAALAVVRARVRVRVRVRIRARARVWVGARLE